jgi:hypothetical protein
MVKPRVIACVFLLIASAGSGQRPLKNTTANPLYPKAGLAIAGVRLGMTPPEVAAAAKASGYRRTEQRMGETWDGRIAHLLALHRSIRVPASGQIVRREEYWKGEEQLQVEYDATELGAMVATVRYELGPNAITSDAFKEAALARYGSPTRPGDSEMMYCSLGEVSCTPIPFPVAMQEPHIVVDMPLRAITLNMGERLRRSRHAAERAEMNRRAPQVKRPTL